MVVSLLKERKMKRFEMFIGRNYKVSNNDSDVTVIESWEKSTIEYCVNMQLYLKGIQGYSADWIIGYWNGEKEDSYHVIIFTDVSEDTMVDIAYALKADLKQESILITINNDIHFIE